MENCERLKFEKSLMQAGYCLSRINGGHKIYENAEGKSASVPIKLHKNTANKLAKECGINWHK